MVTAGCVPLQELERIDDTLQQKARLAIMAALVTLGEASFMELRSAVGLTDGNLSTHLSLLERRGFAEVEKSFRGKRPHTTIKPTAKGLTAFEEYVRTLQQILDLSRGPL